VRAQPDQEAWNLSSSGTTTLVWMDRRSCEQGDHIRGKDETVGLAGRTGRSSDRHVGSVLAGISGPAFRGLGAGLVETSPRNIVNNTRTAFLATNHSVVHRHHLQSACKTLP
jgi:hypothetical protein